MKREAQFVVASYTYVSREFVSKPGENTQGSCHHDIEHQSLRCICVITQTLKN
jgi:hypothetical protein